MKRLPRFYPIVDSAAWVRQLVPAGVRLIQLRIKHQPPGVIRREVREALDIGGFGDLVTRFKTDRARGV